MSKGLIVDEQDVEFFFHLLSLEICLLFPFLFQLRRANPEADSAAPAECKARSKSLHIAF
jgi:hypothetical protein